MALVNYVLITLFYLVTPALVIGLCRRYPLLDKLGPIMVLYAIGMVVGNLPSLPAETALLQEMLPNIMVPLAIPMMLFGCRFTRHEAALQVKLVVSGFLSVGLAVGVGHLLFGSHIAHGAKVGGIISGMYTGGTLNAAALQTVFRIPSEQFVLINSYDILISFFYFLFLFGGGIRLFRYLYGERSEAESRASGPAVDDSPTASKENPYRRLLTLEGWRQTGRIVALTLGVVALSAGVALLLPEGWFMVGFILMLTTLGVLCSLKEGVRRLDMSYDLGMYLIYIFSLAIASMADFSQLDLQSGLNQMAYMVVAVFLSLLLHALFCRLMRLDADSMVVASVAFINSPPFVPMASAAMGNKRSLVTGLGVGIVGYAIGNHFGVVMEWLLSLMG